MTVIAVVLYTKQPFIGWLCIGQYIAGRSAVHKTLFQKKSDKAAFRDSKLFGSSSEIGAIHSDQGFHYTSYRFIQLLKDHALRQSMSRRGNCWDNAPQESFFGHMKDEIDLSGCTAFEQVRAILDDWIDYYNNDRYQWQLAKLSPNEFYTYITSGVYPLQGKPPVHEK